MGRLSAWEAMTGHTVGCHNQGCSRHLVGGGQGCRDTSYRAPDSPPPTMAAHPVSTVGRRRTPDLKLPTPDSDGSPLPHAAPVCVP